MTQTKSNSCLSVGQKETILDQLPSANLQENIDRRQQESDLLEQLGMRNQQIAVLHQRLQAQQASIVDRRLGNELTVLQRKLGIDPNILLAELQTMNEVSIAQYHETGPTVYLEPLFIAYDETVLQQKKFIALLYEQLETSQRQVRSLARDNEQLLEQLQNKCKSILHIYHKGFPEDNLVSAYNALQRESELELVQTVREENDYLSKHAENLEMTLEKAERGFQEARNQADKYFDACKTNAEKAKDSTIRVDDLLKIKEVLEKKLEELNELNHELASKLQQLETKCARLETDLKGSRQQAQSQGKSLRDELENHKGQLHSAQVQLEAAQKRQRETFNRFISLQKETDHLKDSSKQYRRDAEKSKTELEHTLNMCAAFESKVTSMTKKEEAMRQAIQEFRNRFDEALLEKEKALLKIDQYQRIMDNQSQKNRQQTLTLKSSFEKMIAGQNEKISRMEEVIEESEATSAENEAVMRSQLQKIRRENTTLRQENGRLLSNIKTGASVETLTKLKELECANDALSRQVNQKSREVTEQRVTHQAYVGLAQTQIRELNRQIDRERNNSSSHLKDLTQVKSRISTLEADKESLETELRRTKKALDSKGSTNAADVENKLRETEYKLQEALGKEKNTRQKAVQILERHEENQNKLRLEFQGHIRHLETEISRLKTKAQATR